jgi:hypothetical protein
MYNFSPNKISRLQGASTMTPETLNSNPEGYLTLANTTAPDAGAGQKAHSGFRKVVWTFSGVLAVMFIVGFIISRTPALIDVQEHVNSSLSDQPVAGAVTTSMVIEVIDTLLDKPGGYLSNDVIPPAVLLDNMPNWEFGVVTEIRDVLRAMRNDFSRAKSQSAEDADLSNADAQFHFDHTHWILPATEDEFRQGQAALTRYLNRLQSGNARFFARADNLNFYLATVEKRLGNMSQRLGASVREPFLAGLLSKDDSPPETRNAVTPWLEIDDVFFEARGYVWALLHILKGIEIDFAPVLESKDANLLLRRIIENLEHTQNMLLSPIVLNSSGFGMLTNHSLVMASYISRANAAVIDLRLQLSQG